MSGVDPQTGACGGREEYLNISSFLDAAYALSITGIPFIIIFILNLLIIRQLLITRKKNKQSKLLSEENFLKLEFTFVILAMSTSFVALSLPFFITWCHHRISSLGTITDIHSSNEKARGVFFITKAIYYFIYSSNFFLYSLTGAHFRKQLKALCGRKQPTRGTWTSSMSMTTRGVTVTTYRHTAGESPVSSTV